MRDVESLRATLASLAADFAWFRADPDVDRAISVACELLARDLDTPATVEVAALGWRTPLSVAEPSIRDMLLEQGFPAPGPDAGETENLRALLRAVVAGGLDVPELAADIWPHDPEWAEHDENWRQLLLLIDGWVQQDTAEGQTAAAEAVYAFAREITAPGAIAG